MVGRSEGATPLVPADALPYPAKDLILKARESWLKVTSSATRHAAAR
jgi:hypothetical protein